MPDATIKRLDEMESFYDGLVTRARASLGVTSWGMQGYFTIPYAYLTDSNLCDDLWMIQMVA